MWLTFRKIRWTNPALAAISEEVLEASTRKLILAISLVLACGAVGATLVNSAQVSLLLAPILVVSFYAAYLALRMASRRVLLGQALWLVGYIASVLLVYAVVGNANVLLLFILAPFFAVVLIGWPAGLVTGGVVIMVMLAVNLLVPGQVITAAYFWMVLFGCCLFGFAGWAALTPVLSMLEYAVERASTASQYLEEARNQRLELRQVQSDLVLANKELSRVAKQLKIMGEKADEARRVKEEFVAHVSHELRTPLNMIIGYADMIMKSPRSYGKNLPSRLLADIAAIQRNSEHLVELINDVLDLSQVDAGHMTLTRRWVPVQEIVDSAVAGMRQFFASRGLYLEKDTAGSEILVYCDPTRIREVVLNLLSNAGRYTDCGGVNLRVWQEPNRVVVAVEDTGRGIAPENQAMIFEPFRQVDPLLHHQTGGSGLGLAISKRFIEMHEGQMWLESELGKGTTMYFSLPVNSPEPQVSSGASVNRWINPYIDYLPRSRRFKVPRQEAVPHIVIVEQEKVIERIFNRYQNQVEISSFGTIAEAVETCLSTPVQMLVLNTPPNSSEAASAAEKSLPGIPLIKCWLPGREEAARQLGVVQYLLKPVPQEVLLATLASIGKEALNVLLVDDDRETLLLFARMIAAAQPQYQIIRARNGAEALKMLRERQPDVMLLDLIMPAVDGYQVLQQKQTDPEIRDIPVIVVSSTDPAGLPVLSTRFEVLQSAGLSAGEFVHCLTAIQEALNAAPPRPGPGLPENAPA